jgi:hypothetical protein
MLNIPTPEHTEPPESTALRATRDEHPGGDAISDRRRSATVDPTPHRNARTELKDVLDEEEIIRNLSEMMGGSKARLNHCFKVDRLVYDELLTAEAATATAH